MSLGRGQEEHPLLQCLTLGVTLVPSKVLLAQGLPKPRSWTGGLVPWSGGPSGLAFYPESEMLWEVRRIQESQVHCQGPGCLRSPGRGPHAWPRVPLLDIKFATLYHTSLKCKLNFPRKRFPRTTFPCGLQWVFQRQGEASVLSLSGPWPPAHPMDNSSRAFQKGAKSQDPGLCPHAHH